MIPIFELDAEFILVLQCINRAMSCPVVHRAGGYRYGRIRRTGGMLVVFDNTTDMTHSRLPSSTFARIFSEGILLQVITLMHYFADNCFASPTKETILPTNLRLEAHLYLRCFTYNVSYYRRNSSLASNPKLHHPGIDSLVLSAQCGISTAV